MELRVCFYNYLYSNTGVAFCVKSVAMLGLNESLLRH